MQASSQRRHASAQTRQCSCISACPSHSSAQVAHASRHDSSCFFDVGASYSVWRVITRPVASQNVGAVEVEADALAQIRDRLL